MQEQEHIACSGARAGIHLAGSAGARRKHPVGKALGQIGRAVARSAVDYDHFMAATAQFAQGFERGDNAFGFVERGDDDRQSFHSADRSKSGPKLELILTSGSRLIFASRRGTCPPRRAASAAVSYTHL